MQLIIYIYQIKLNRIL